VEWGAGVFGIEAAAQHYHRKPAARLTVQESARLAVMLPSPKRFELTPQSRYLASRTQTIVLRMSAVTVP
jgi:monofunctional biosynthetic peptidoglycan transglycosylase